jgi:cytochrome P450 family 4
MGIKMSQLKESDEYRKNIYEIGKLVLFRMMRPWLYSHFVYELLGHRKFLDRFVKPAHAFTSGIIKQRRTLFHDKRQEFEDISSENM